MGVQKNPITILKLIFKAYYIVYKHNIDSIHIVNEQVYFFLYPLSFFKRCVLDQFDSILNSKLSFLKKNPIFPLFFL